LYALGEIVLVVIGILIALQINNWNESRQDREIYRSYLVRLRSDIELIQETVRQKRAWEVQLIDLAQYQLDVLTGEVTSPDPLKLAMSIEFTASVNRYEISSPTYKELNSTGRLALIENDSIRDFLSSYDLYIAMREDQKAEWDPWTHEYRSQVRGILYPEDREFIDFEFGDENADLQSPNWKNYKLRTPEKSIIRGLSSIPDLQGLLRDVLTARQITLIFMDQEIENSSYLLALIDSELNRLSSKS
jgi:hypothetical protein